MTRYTAVTAVLFLLAAGPAAAQIPAEFQGDWVPAAQACTSAARVRFEVTRITLVNGTDMESFGGVEMAGPAYFPPGYRGIQAVAYAEFSGDQPMPITFNLRGKKGMAQVEFSPITRSPRPSPIDRALNAHLTKSNLAKRFPLDQVPLRRCAAVARTSGSAAPLSGRAVHTSLLRHGDGGNAGN
jgi:hypothetical protein